MSSNATSAGKLLVHHGVQVLPRPGGLLDLQRKGPWMSDLEQALSEAQRAREEAEAAARRAADLEAQAEAARERAQQEDAERRRTWAQTIVDTYDTEISNADAAIQQAHEQFNRVAVENLSGAVEAYSAWGEASMRHY